MWRYICVVVVVSGLILIGYKAVVQYYRTDELGRNISRAAKQCFWPASILMGGVSEATTPVVFAGEIRTLFWLFKQHEVSRVRIGTTQPPIYCYVAIYEQSKAYALPKEFNAVIKNERVHIDTDDAALEMVWKYIRVTGDLEAVIVSDADEIQDIPAAFRASGRFLKVTIKPPRIAMVHEGREVSVYSWKQADRRLEQWKIIVRGDGTIIVKEQKTLAK